MNICGTVFIQFQNMQICSISNKSILQLQCPYQLIVNHHVFHPTISMEKSFPSKHRVLRAHKEHQNIVVERYTRQARKDTFCFLSIPLTDNSFWEHLATLQDSPSHNPLQVSPTLGITMHLLLPYVRRHETHILEEKPIFVIKEE